MREEDVFANLGRACGETIDREILAVLSAGPYPDPPPPAPTRALPDDADVICQLCGWTSRALTLEDGMHLYEEHCAATHTGLEEFAAHATVRSDLPMDGRWRVKYRP